MPGDISNTDQLQYLEERLGNRARFELSEVVSQFWRASLYNSLISKKKFLALAAQFVEEINPPEFRRLDFYKYVDARLVNNDITSEKLKELAFVMELLQVNSLAHHDTLRLLAAEEIIHLEAQGLLVREKDTVSFSHSTIHSYYSALFLCTHNNPVKFFDDLVTSDKNNTPIPVIWYEVIGFCLEIVESNSFSEWIVNSLRRYPVLIEEGLLNAIEQARIDRHLTTRLKKTLFKVLFDLYKEKQIWLPDSAEILLARLARESEVETLEAVLAAEYTTETELLVTKANSIGVIDEILKLNPNSIAKEHWHELLIEYANHSSTNGVLQRRALKALGHYKRASDIRKLKEAGKHPDRLVHEAFLIFCYTVAPNSRQTIQYLADGLLKDCEIFARYGFYEISNETGIHFLLTTLSSDTKYISKFMDGESIFNDGDRHEDDKILSLIRKFNSRRVLADSKKLILTSYRSGHGYHAERSYFVNELIKIATDSDADYALEIAGQIENEDHIYQISSLIAQSTTIDNYLQVIEVLSKRHEKFVTENFMYIMANEGRDDIYRDAIRRGVIKERPASHATQSEDDYETKRKQKIYKDFRVSLEPEKGKYLTNVFKLFLGDQEIIQDLATNAEIDRFKTLTKDVILDRFDPADIKVRIKDHNPGDSKTSYTITSYASYYGDAASVATKLFGKDFVLTHYRDRLVSYLPYAYYEDRKFILDLVGTLSAEQIETLNAQYSNKQSDTRYFMTDSYLYILGNQLEKQQELRTAIPVLKSFIEDPRLRQHEREEAIAVYGRLIGPHDTADVAFLRRLFNRHKNQEDSQWLAEMANEILVTVFHDKVATRWRFDEIEKRAAPFVMEMGMHSVGRFENELYDKTFGRPLVQLDRSYVNRFIKLLDYSLEILSKDKNQYMNYASYIWSLSYEYFEQLSKSGDLEPLKRLERWYKNHSKAVEGANWFEHRLEQLRKSYAAEINRLDGFGVALARLEGLKDNG